MLYVYGHAGLYSSTYVCCVANLSISCVIIQLSCLATLSVAAGAVSTVNDIKDYGELEHADKYRGAAGWLVFVGLAGVFYHGIIIFILILYFAANIGRSFAGFSCSVSDCRAATD